MNHRREPFHRPRLIEHRHRGQSCMFVGGQRGQKLRTDPRVDIAHHVDFPSERRKEMACRNVQITAAHAAVHVGKIQVLRNMLKGIRDNPC